MVQDSISLSNTSPAYFIGLAASKFSLNTSSANPEGTVKDYKLSNCMFPDSETIDVENNVLNSFIHFRLFIFRTLNLNS